jgi:hypothetical protein
VLALADESIEVKVIVTPLESHPDAIHITIGKKP